MPSRHFRPRDPFRFDGYQGAKDEQALAEKECKEAGQATANFPRLPNGLTPDAVKASPEWQAANLRWKQAFARLRYVNAYLAKHHKKEEKEARNARFLATGSIYGKPKP